MKKEREHKKKQEALTIEETKEEIANTEARLAQLKEEKHQLFHTLKKVIARPLPLATSSVIVFAFFPLIFRMFPLCLVTLALLT